MGRGRQPVPSVRAGGARRTDRLRASPRCADAPASAIPHAVTAVSLARHEVAGTGQMRILLRIRRHALPTQPRCNPRRTPRMAPRADSGDAVGARRSELSVAVRHECCRFLLAWPCILTGGRSRFDESDVRRPCDTTWIERWDRRAISRQTPRGRGADRQSEEPAKTTTWPPGYTGPRAAGPALLGARRSAWPVRGGQ